MNRAPQKTLLWRTAAKIASRELRATPGKFLFVVLAVAAGVGALSGVRGFSMAARSMLLRDARKLMAADVMMRLREAPSAEQKATLDALSAQGIVRTTITETISMSVTTGAPVPQMVTIKAVDPRVYPFYGAITLAPPQSLAEALRADTVAASDDLLQRLKTGVGQTLRLGGKDFRIVAALITEPDRLSGNPMAGARILMSRDALERTGLIGPGSRAQNRLLFRLTPSAGVEDVKSRLQKAFPGAQIIDYRETDPGITRGLDSSTVFLSLVSLVALIVGSLGVAMAMHSHMQQKMDTIAIMKSIGARSGQIMRIYLLETVWLGLAGGVLGIALGAAVQRAFPVLIQRFFDQRPDIVWSWSFVAQGMAAGLASTVLFTLPALLRVRRVRPVLVLRREMEETTSASGFPARAKSTAAIGVPLILGFGLIAVWIGNSWEIGGYFTGGLLASLLALSAVAWLLLRSLRWFLRAAPWKLPPTLRHGIANLYRPGNQAQPVLVSLGVGVMFTLTVFLVQRSIVGDIVSKAPPERPTFSLWTFVPNKSRASPRWSKSRRASTARWNSHPRSRCALPPSMASPSKTIRMKT
ncbi:MAG: FtsX-like permease family protein [Bryobacterales bacterium]|nr:FtsX-like permease family protein [Bryobacterales bacterium]